MSAADLEDLILGLDQIELKVDAGVALQIIYFSALNKKKPCFLFVIKLYMHLGVVQLSVSHFLSQSDQHLREEGRG